MSSEGGRLAGDQITQALSATGPLDDRARNGGTDPQSLADFLAYDIPFRTEPATNVVFPPEAQPGERVNG